MNSREEALEYGLSFPDTYVETPFHDTNWQLVRVKGSKKAFLWIYEKDGYINLNVKADREWRDYWRSAFRSVIAGYHQNKEHWNTIILDGSVPDDAIKTMIRESYEIITDNPTVAKVVSFNEMIALEHDVRELRRVQGTLPGARLIIADCGLTEDARGLAEYLAAREENAAVTAGPDIRLE